MNQNLTFAESNEMFVTPHLHSDSLPNLLQDFLTVGKTTQEQDILLISALTTLSSAFPNLYMRYGHTGKIYFPNLQTFIMAGAASGKGLANLAEQLICPLHEQKPLIIPGDSTYPAFYQTLLEQDGQGMLLETEGSVITDIWRSGCTTYNTALRKAAEHETISKNRLTTGGSEIRNPKVSMLLTGTFDQFRHLVPNVENGYFSRLNMLVLRDQPDFDETVFCPNEQGAAVQQLMNRLSRQVLQLSEKMTTPTEFRLTPAQATQIGALMKKEYDCLLHRLGSGFHATIIRNGVSLMRIAAILTVLRKAPFPPSEHPFPVHFVRGKGEIYHIECGEEDFRTAVVIATKLLHHAAEAYQQIGGTSQLTVPEQKESFQKDTFLATLPDHFTTAECTEQAQMLGACSRTARRWLNAWLEQGTIIKLEHGVYQKAA